MRKNIAFAIVLLLPLIIFAIPQTSFGGFANMGNGFSINAGLTYVGIGYQNDIVYKITKIVKVPFFGDKKIIVPIKLGKNNLKVYYDGNINIQDHLNINVYNLIKSNILANLNSKMEFDLSSFVSYKNYSLFFSNKDFLVSFGGPFGLSLKYKPLLVGMTLVQNDNFLFSVNTKGIDVVILYESVKIFVDTINENIVLDISIPIQ